MESLGFWFHFGLTVWGFRVHLELRAWGSDSISGLRFEFPLEVTL